ncbi:MAG: hypothetical protein HQK86_15100 [Nitrospinae bacterium]|nr:hypothetical protein [Nitrospinota bacterium]MBF0633547.1 hypothetical protein [Nitrospinota bacterium]
MNKAPVIQFSQWLSLFRAAMETEYGMEITNPMYHEMVVYRKLYDTGCSPMTAIGRLMETETFPLCLPAL